MAGINPTQFQGGTQAIIQGNTAQGVLQLGTAATTTALKATPFAAAAGPIGIIAGVIGGVIGAIFARHAQKVKQEAQIMGQAVPAWRDSLRAIVQAFNQGQIDANTAVSAVSQVKLAYYNVVKPIQRGNPGVGRSPAEYLQPHGRFAPIDPCNAACNVGYFDIEPESRLVSNALASNKDVDVQVVEIAMLNGAGTVPAEILQIRPPILSTITSQLPSVVRDHPYAIGLAVIAGLILLKR